MKKLALYTFLVLGLSTYSGKILAQTDSIEGRPVSTETAVSLATQQDYNAAIRQYEQIIQTDPSLINYYNLGVCYNALGRTKDAIIAYERALLLDPSLIEARHNVRLAYASTKDALGDGRSFDSFERLFYYFSIGQLRLIAYILFALSLTLALLLWISRRSGLVQRSQVFFTLALACLILWVLDLALIAHQVYYHEQDMRRAIINQTQELKPSPTSDGNTVITLHEGTAIFLEGQTLGHFQEVRLPDGRRGYLPLPSFTRIVTPSTQAE